MLNLLVFLNLGYHHASNVVDLVQEVLDVLVLHLLVQLVLTRDQLSLVQIVIALRCPAFLDLVRVDGLVVVQYQFVDDQLLLRDKASADYAVELFDRREHLVPEVRLR